jgi:hypothetical protein
MTDIRSADQPSNTIAMRIIQPGARYLGCLLLLGIGAIHLYEYTHDHYNVIPVIGPLFVINFAFAVALALLIAAPIERLSGVGRLLLRLLMLGAIGFAASTIAGLLISEASTLFGFHEQGYRTTITLSLALEAGAIVLFAVFLALESSRTTTRPQRSPATSQQSLRPRARQPGLPAQQRGA